MSRKRIKQYLMLLTVVGLIAVAANGSGTFASFTAETTNAGNTFATGTLFLHNTVNGQTCTSESSVSSTSTDNLQTSGCGTLFSVGADAANATEHADLTLTNAGSIDSPNITFTIPSCDPSVPTIATLTSAVTNSGDATGGSLAVSNLTQDLVANTPIELTDKTTTSQHQDFTVDTNGATKGPTASIPVTGTGSSTFNYAYQAGSTVTVHTQFAGGSGLCGQLKLAVASYPDNTFSGTSATCIYGGTTDTTNGGCTAGTGTAVSTIVSNGATGLGVALNKASTKYLRIYLSAPDLGNADQNEEANFDVTWHIEQA